MLSNQPVQPHFEEAQVQQDIKRALQILTNKAPSNEQVQQCNKVVIEHLKKSENLAVLLRVLILVGDNQDQVNLVLSFIGHYLNVQSRPGIGVVRHCKDEICEKIKKIFFCKTVSDKSKKILQNSFSNFISTLSADFMRLRKKLCKQTIQFFITQKQLTSTDLNDSLFIVEALLTDSLQTENLILLEETLLIRFIQLSIKLIREFDDYLFKEQNFILSQEQLNTVIWTQKILQITELLFCRAKSQRLLVLKMRVSISTELAHICSIGLKLSHQRDHFIFQCENYDNMEQKIFYEKIDEMKLNILGIMNNSFAFLLKSRRNLAEQKFIPVLETSKSFINETVPMIEKVLSGYPTKAIKNMKNVQEGLALLAKLIKIPALLNEFTQIRNLVLWKICLPCFITTENQKKLSCEDFCDKKQKNVAAEETLNITQAAVQVVESYFDHIYGSIPFTAKALINLMDFQLTADPKYFEEIPESLASSQFYNNFTYFQQFQVSLSVMSTMSYHADNREDVTVLLEQFVLRRQQFFSRIDVPAEMIVSFLQCCAYYLQNFYQLIISGKANADFHRALIFHSTELLAFSFDQNTKNFKNNDVGKIGTQAIDYLSNSLIQDLFFSAIFPAWNQKSTSLLVRLMQKISVFMNSAFNIKVIENILIDFLVRCTDRHFVNKNQFASMPEPLRMEISQVLIDQILKHFTPHLKNESIAKQKLLQLFSLIIRICKQPTKLMLKSLQLFNHIIEQQFSFIQQLLTIADIYLKRNQRESLNPTPQLTFVLFKLGQKSIKICDNDTFNNQVFNLFLSLNLLQISQQEVTLTLLETFEQRLQQRQTDEDAELTMEKILYLLMQISFTNFFSVSPKVWLEVLKKMINYLSQNYIRQDTIIIGKCTIICLSCYIQDPSGVQNVFGNKMEAFWDCILSDQLKYSTVAQKRTICILLTRLLGEHFSKTVIKDKYISILRTVCIIMYYIYEKPQIQMSEEDDESMSQKDEDDDQLYKDKAWKQLAYTMKQNPFVSNLPDDREMLKDLCVKLNETDHNSFVKFVDGLPMGMQNLVKNKILMYKCDTGVANKKKMRTIYKVKLPNSQEIQEQQNKRN